MSTSGNYTKGNIKLIDNVKITNSDPTSRTVSQGIYFAEHHNDDAVVQNCTITGYRRGIENHSKIDKIINNTINCNYNGIYNEAEEYGSPLESTINLIDNNNITLSRSTGGSGILNFKGGIIDKISNNSITGQEAGIACERNNSLIRVLENNTVKSYNYGIRVLETGKIGEIKSGWYEDVTATGQGLWIASDGSKVETISGGTIIGKQNGVLISNNGALGTITGDPVFYGKAKYAIDNTDQKSPINIEPTLQQDLPPIGYARYYGPTGFIVNEPEKDIYPNYTPGGYDYFMSVIGTDENVDELEGIPFHYLTINVALSYDKNAEKATGDMSNKSKLVEAGTVLTIEDNLFEYKDHEFIIWNTKSNNSGTPYQPQDSITLLEDTILYAQWRSPAPKTGDNSSYGLWLSILIVSMFVIIMDIRYILKSKKA